MGWQLIGYACVLGVAAALLQWLDYAHAVRSMPGEVYIALLAIGFMALGRWAGNRLTRRAPSAPFQRNDAAIRSLGLSPRECELLALLASGRSNKELARDLGISPNTVKTHLARLFEKLGVGRRIEAIEKARMLALIE